MVKRRTDSHWFAPGCHTGYPNGPKALLFAALKDDDLRKKWECHLHRKDKVFPLSLAVCEHHFEPHLVLRDYGHVINGNEVQILRGKPSLALDPAANAASRLPIVSFCCSTTTKAKKEEESSTNH
ncbi:hypothetical protein HPB50_006768 [Hyalomma asiaticum]|uniref:Uncharacterized protein n=1 Tax=Hyalomma asiaticum TaxID=266040 RepID=A0ACB7SKR2_HYAAI|nr:hypothetical protein HPB50_006768 [Hyalomma asiaticum]